MPLKPFSGDSLCWAVVSMACASGVICPCTKPMVAVALNPGVAGVEEVAGVAEGSVAETNTASSWFRSAPDRTAFVRLLVTLGV